MMRSGDHDRTPGAGRGALTASCFFSIGRATIPPHSIAALVHTSVAGGVLSWFASSQVVCRHDILALSNSLPLTHHIFLFILCSCVPLLEQAELP